MQQQARIARAVREAIAPRLRDKKSLLGKAYDIRSDGKAVKRGRGERVYSARVRMTLRALADLGMTLKPMPVPGAVFMVKEGKVSRKTVVRTAVLTDLYVKSPKKGPEAVYRYPGWQLNLKSAYDAIYGLFDRDGGKLLCIKRIRRNATKVTHTMILLDRIEMVPFPTLYRSDKLGSITYAEWMYPLKRAL